MAGSALVALQDGVMVPVAIQFNGVTKTFGKQTILKDFDLTIQKGEFISIVGPSGCGKSTVLKMISGLEEYDSGQLTVMDSETEPETQAADPANNQCGTAFVFQEANLLPWLTAFDNIALPFRITGKPVDKEKLTQVLQLVGLSPESHGKYPAQLSGGMKMRVSIARSLVLDPLTLLLDEPFAALDDLLRTSLNCKLMEIWQRDQQTMLFVTHNIAEAVFVSQKILVMHRGIQTPACVEIGFDYPREKSIKSSREFADAFAQVSTLLEETSRPPESEVEG
jgi:NitT/TauT family transport system ATP-binding protein